MKAKSLAILLLSTSLFTVSSLTSVQSVSATKSAIPDKSSVVYNLDNTGEKLKDFANFEPIDLDINDINVSYNQINLSGEIIDEELKSQSFELEGELKKTEHSDKLVVGNLNDRTGNYEVIYFAIDNDTNNNISLIPDQYDDNETVVKLYLLEKDSKTLYIVENNELGHNFDNQSILANTANFVQAEHTDIFWPSKIFQPANSYDTNSSIAPFAMTSGKSDVTHTLVYNAGVVTVTEKMTVRTYVEGDTVLKGSGTFNTKLYPLSVSTTVSSGTTNSSTSSWKIGVLRDTQLQAYTDPGDYISSSLWDAAFTNASSIKLKMDWALTVPNTGLSFGLAYTNSSEFTNTKYKIYDNSGTNKSRAISLSLNKDNHLTKTDHTFDASITVAHYDTPKQKRLNLRWTYYMYNNQNIYASVVGEKTSNQYFSYSSSSK